MIPWWIAAAAFFGGGLFGAMAMALVSANRSEE